MRLIDADARVTVQSFDEEHEEYNHTEMSVEEALDFATDEGCPPFVDAVPVIRCKDCKWFRDSNGIDGLCYCDRIYRHCGTHWFCASGERRESE